MTDGTSQGLFIVVAIVIFGIFILLAYILLEDTLSPAMASMFTTATEQSQNSLPNHSLISARDFEILDLGGSSPRISKYKRGIDWISYSHNGASYTNAVYFPATKLEPDKEYVFSYDITELSGSIRTLGGHSSQYDSMKFYIDGVLMEGGGQEQTYSYAVILPEGKSTYHVKIEFDTTGMASVLKNTHYNSGIHIQPNRHYPRWFVEDYVEEWRTIPEYEVKIENIRLYYAE